MTSSSIERDSHKQRLWFPTPAAPAAPHVKRHTSMDQRLVIHLETPFASCGLSVEEARGAVLMGLSWPTEYWVDLAIGWLEQSALLDAELAAALDAVTLKPFSQGVRHRAFALVRQWQRVQLAPDLAFKRTPNGSA